MTDLDSMMMPIERNWDFTPSRSRLRYTLRYHWRFLYAQGSGPAWECLCPPTLQKRWQIYFMFLRDGVCTDVHEYTLKQLKSSDMPVLVVCAAPGPEDVPETVRSYADALYWKGLDGYDFSGYTVGLHAIAEHSPGADVVVLNDSIFGPFNTLDAYVDRAQWDLTGFTADAGGENHIQSSSFILKKLTPDRLHQLKLIFNPDRSWQKNRDVIICQELRLARVASKSMSVGAFLYYPSNRVDPTLSYPSELIDHGHPFLKKSLLTKHTWSGNSDFAVQYLKQVGHPEVA